MTVAELKEWFDKNNIPDDAKISFWGYDDGAFIQETDDIDYNKELNRVEIGY